MMTLHYLSTLSLPLTVKKIQSGENIVSIENGALNSLEAKEVMEGDSNLMGTIVCKTCISIQRTV